jgi:hypothetical protein
MKKILILALLFIQTSCVTKALWGDKEYKERISQFLVGTDGRYVVFVGDNYHYIFTDNSETLKAILSLGKNIVKIDTKATRLKLDKNNNVDGELVMVGSSLSLTPQELYSLRMIGIYPDRYNEILVRMKVSGRRYAAKYIGSTQGQLSNSQVVTIRYNDSNAIKDVGKVAVTPIAVGVDAVLLIGKVVVKVFEL